MRNNLFEIKNNFFDFFISGTQGGSIVNLLHDTGRYRICALTHNVTSEGKALASEAYGFND